VSSPNAHAVHHTRSHGWSNFGNSLLIWDWMFGTIHIPEQAPSDFGIDEPEVTHMGILEQTLLPFGIQLCAHGSTIMVRASSDPVVEPLHPASGG
jgi:hypothetical protein